MATEQTMRVSARGEFGQLQRGLKNLQSDLKNVVGEIDRGARKGGIFDDSQLRALDLFKRRFKETMGELDREFQHQNATIDKLHEKMAKAGRSERDDIKKNIDAREKELDVIRKKMFEMDKLYDKRNTESKGFNVENGKGSSGSSWGASAGSKLLGAGKFALGMAGVGSILALVSEAYQKAYYRQTGTLDLSQRLRGGGGFSGSNTAIYDSIGQTGMRDRMGYSKQESFQFQDALSRQAGYVNTDEQYRLQKFGRSYGLTTSEVAGNVGTNFQLGGGAPSKYADYVAGSVGQSGMTPRIVEVMEANNGLLQQLNTTFKDGSSKQILSYQTTLDKIGTEKGMTRLTGAQGANVIGGFGGIYQPGNDQWKWMGIRALQGYNPKKYGKMGLYDLEGSFEDGLMNKDNMPAMLKYLKGKAGGNNDMFKRMIQRWLQSGGFNATKTEVNDLYGATNGMDAFNPDKINSVMNGIQNGNSGAKYDSERKNLTGQGYLDTNARFEQALEGIGSKFVDAVQGLKEATTKGLEALNGTLSDDWSKNIYEYLSEHWKEVAVVGGIALIAKGVGVIGSILTVWNALNRGGKIPPGGGNFPGGGGGTATPVEEPKSVILDKDGKPMKPSTTPKTVPKVPGKFGGLSRILGIAGDVALPIAAAGAMDEVGQRDQAGDSKWGSLWKSLANYGSLGLYNPDMVQNGDQAYTNKTMDIQASVDQKAGLYNANIGRAGLSGDNLTQAHRNYIDSSYTDLKKEFGIDTSTQGGAVGMAQLLKSSFGASASDAPEELQKSLKKYGIDFDSVNKITDGNKGDFFARLLGKSTKSKGYLDLGTDASQAMANEQAQIGDQLKDFSKTSKDNLKGLSDQGTSDISKLQKDGSDSFGLIYKDSSEKFKAMQDKHSSTMDFIKDKFTGLSSLLSGGGGSFGSGSLVDMASKVIFGNEGNYGSVTQNDNGALSIGKLQWHGNRARDLLKSIKEKDPTTFGNNIPMMSQLNADLDKDWSNRTLSSWEAQKIQSLLGTDAGKKAQDELANKDVSGYLDKGKELGITDNKALAYFADLYNQSPQQAMTIAGKSDKTLKGLYDASMSDGIMGKYPARRTQTYNDILSGNFSGSGGAASGSGSSQNAIKIDLNITGDGASQLNQATYSQLEALVRKIVGEVAAQKLSMVPTVRTGG